MEVVAGLAVRAQCEYQGRYDEGTDEVEDEAWVGLQAQGASGNAEQ